MLLLPLPDSIKRLGDVRKLRPALLLVVPPVPQPGIGISFRRLQLVSLPFASRASRSPKRLIERTSNSSSAVEELSSPFTGCCSSDSRLRLGTRVPLRQRHLWLELDRGAFDHRAGGSFAVVQRRPRFASFPDGRSSTASPVRGRPALSSSCAVRPPETGAPSKRPRLLLFKHTCTTRS